MLLGDGLCSLQEVAHNSTLLCEGSCLLDAVQQATTAQRSYRGRARAISIDVDAGAAAAGDDDDDVQIVPLATSQRPQII